MRPLALALVLLLGGAASTTAQVVSDERLWVNVTVQERAGTESPWRWYMEFGGRTRNDLNTLDQTVLRPAIGYDLTRRSTVWAGYVHLSNHPPGGGVISDHRAWQQYVWAHPALGGTFQARSRLEERWIEGADAVAWRIRQQVRMNLPVSTRAGLTLSGWEELLVHANNTSRTVRGIDQNRFYGGLGVAVGRHARVEAGYMNQAVHVPAGLDRRNHVLSTVVNLTY